MPVPNSSNETPIRTVHKHEGQSSSRPINGDILFTLGLTGLNPINLAFTIHPKSIELFNPVYFLQTFERQLTLVWIYFGQRVET